MDDVPNTTPSIVSTPGAFANFDAAFGPYDAGSLAARLRGDYDLAFGFRPWQREAPPMAKGKKKLEVVHLVCEETGDQNYTLRRKTGGEKLKVKKYSPRLRKHTVHNEKRK